MIANTAAYHFTPIADPDALCATLLERATAGGLRGTILVAGEGINLFLAGTDTGIADFYAALHADPRFAGLRVKTSYSQMQPFARLKAKVKPEIISFRIDDGQPLAYPRAPSVDPATVQRWLRQGHDDAGKPVVMLDTRNTQEIEYGTFQDALVLPITKFTDLPDALAPHREALRDSTVVSFCTGGIRCERPRCGCATTAWTTCCSWTAASWGTSRPSAAKATRAGVSCSTSAWRWTRTCSRWSINPVPKPPERWRPGRARHDRQLRGTLTKPNRRNQHPATGTGGGRWPAPSGWDDFWRERVHAIVDS